MLAPNASFLEIGWTLIAFLGAAFALALLAHIWLSYRTVNAWIREGLAVRWGPRHRFVLGFLIGVGLLLLVWLGFLLLGANALTNPPPTTPDRVEASERGGAILVVVEGILLASQAGLLAAWIAVGKPSLHPVFAVHTPMELLIAAIDAGREMGHAVANDLQPAIALLDEIRDDEAMPEDLRIRAAEAAEALDQVLVHVRAVHQEIKALEPRP